jgi:glycerophosphoryl diester phosphodiesterase
VAPLFARWREDIRDIANNLDAVAINIAATSITAARMQTLRKSRLPIFAYTVNAPGKADKLQQLGLKGIFTDRPDKFEKYLLI